MWLHGECFIAHSLTRLSFIDINVNILNLGDWCRGNAKELMRNRFFPGAGDSIVLFGMKVQSWQLYYHTSVNLS